MSAKDKKSDVFSYFKNVKCEFLAEHHIISLSKGLLNTSSHLSKSEVFSYFKNVKCEFLARHHTISLNKGLLNTSSHLC